MVLKVATELFIEEGYDKTSIRKIADRIEYSPATIYLYFKDKDEIFHAIHEVGFGIFFHRMEALEIIENPYERLRKLGEAYIRFAYEYPEYYDLMFIMRAPMEFIQGDTWDCGYQAHEGLKKIIRQCMEEGYMKSMDVDLASLSIWSFMHGMTSLAIRNRFKMYESKQVRQLMDEAVDTMLQLFRKG